MRRMSFVLAVVTVLTLAGCSSSPATPAPGTLAQGYFNSLTEDERANLAAYGTPDEFLGSLLGAYQCQDPGNHRGCPPAAAVTATAHRLGGTLYERTIVVKHHDGHFELLPLYVATHANGSAELIDDTGRAYPGGLNDFRAHNSMLSSADLVLLAKPVTETGGSFRLQVVTGHTPGSARWPYLLIGVLALGVMLAAAMLIIARQRHAAAEGDQNNNPFATPEVDRGEVPGP